MTVAGASTVCHFCSRKFFSPHALRIHYFRIKVCHWARTRQVASSARSGIYTSTCPPRPTTTVPRAPAFCEKKKMNANPSQKMVLERHFEACPERRSYEEYAAIAREVSGLDGGKAFDYKNVETWFLNRRYRAGRVDREAKPGSGSFYGSAMGGQARGGALNVGGQGLSMTELNVAAPPRTLNVGGQGALTDGSSVLGRVLRRPEQRLPSRIALLSIQSKDAKLARPHKVIQRETQSIQRETQSTSIPPHQRGRGGSRFRGNWGGSRLAIRGRQGSAVSVRGATLNGCADGGARSPAVISRSFPDVGASSKTRLTAEEFKGNRTNPRGWIQCRWSELIIFWLFCWSLPSSHLLLTLL